MPTTLGGLAVFVILIVPGCIYYVQRRAGFRARPMSPLAETATWVTVSVTTNVLTLLLFGMFRMAESRHTPDVGRLFAEGSAYVVPRIGYLLGWASAIVVMSSTFAFVLGARPGAVGRFAQMFAPAVVDCSARFHAFEGAPAGTRVYIGCDFDDDRYVGGFLDWYSAEPAAAGEQDSVRAEPIVYRLGDSEERMLEGVARMVLSGHDVRRLHVSYVRDQVGSAVGEA